MTTKAHRVRIGHNYDKAIVDTVREPLIILDAKLHVLTANRAFYKKFDLNKRETESKLIYKLGDGQWGNPKLRHLLENILPRKTFFENFEITHEFSKIGSRIILLNARKLLQEKQNEPMILISMEDITERRQIEQQKDDFIAIASHELKTPVTSMKTYAQLLQRNPMMTKDKRASYMLTQMDTQMNRLTELVSSFMNVYKVQSGKLELKKQLFQLNELITEGVNNFQYTIDSHVVERIGDTKVTVRADREKIDQVIVNLITNAIKYSPNADRIIVGLTSDTAKATVSVQDFGMGIPKEEQSRIYERFFRAKGKKEGKIPGLGLGLFISAEIVKQHGGKLWMNSIEGKGSTFYFTLPVYKKRRALIKNKRLFIHAFYLRASFAGVIDCSSVGFCFNQEQNRFSKIQKIL